MSFLDRDMVYNAFQRQMDIIQPSEIVPITLIGCGSSGSAIGAVYTKMGGNLLTLYDADFVESHNLPNQWYTPEYIARNKARALEEVLMKMAPVGFKPTILANNYHYQEGNVINGIPIMCVDSIETRKAIFEELVKTKRTDWLVDTRMASQFYEIYTIKLNNEKDISEYRESLNLEMEEAPCTDRSVIYTPMLMASRVVWFIKRISRNEPVYSHYLEDLSNVLMPIQRDWRTGEEPVVRGL